MGYVRADLQSFRGTVEEFFPALAPFISLYASYPFKTSIVRLGPNGVIIAHQPGKATDIQVMDVTEFQPPMESVNIVDIIARLNAAFCSFDILIRSYASREAEE